MFVRCGLAQPYLKIGYWTKWLTTYRTSRFKSSIFFLPRLRDLNYTNIKKKKTKPNAVEVNLECF